MSWTKWKQALEKAIEFWGTQDNGDEMDSETLDKVNDNLYWQKRLEWDFPTVVKALGSMSISTIESSEFIKGVNSWQRANKLIEDGVVGPNTWAMMEQSLLTPYARAVRKIMEPTIGKESSGKYWAMNKDYEFRGKFKNHRAEGKIHIGLSFGILQFTQDGGSLGLLLKRFAKANPERFKSIMGHTWDTVLKVTNMTGPSGMDSGAERSPRVRKIPVIVDANGTVEDKDLWEEPWVTKFARLGHVPEFQQIQRELAEEEYLEPMLKYLDEHNLRSEKVVAAAFSGAIHRGCGGMRKFMGQCIEKSETEIEVLHCMVKRDPSRFQTFKDDSTLGWQDWPGWRYM